MRDSLEFLFRQRFRGHEAPVEPYTWQAIQQSLGNGAAAEGSGLEDLMRDRFHGHELDVDPTLWGNINAQLGHGVAASTATGGMLGWAAAGLGILALGGALFFLSPTDPVIAVAMDAGPAERQTTAPERMADAEAEALAGTSVVVPIPAAIAEPRVTSPAVQPPPAPFADAMDTATQASTIDRPAVVASSMGEAAAAMADPAPGEAVVERIIEDLTERVKQEVIAQSNQPKDAAAVQPDSPDQELEQPAMRNHPELFLQNTFTPNGDGINDDYRVSTEGFSRVMVKVFSVKNNQLVFSTATSEPWTGDNCEDGYYLVAVEAMTAEGQLVSKGQVVWLNRDTRY